jgi:hypothetical protein
MSGASARKGLSFRTLDAEGFKGDPPEFPLPEVTAREAEIWAEVWRTPQAIAWRSESWRWRIVGMYVRISALCESPEVTGALVMQLHRYGDQIGMTPAGLKENGWAIGATEAEAEGGKPEDGAEVVDLFRASSG